MKSEYKVSIIMPTYNSSGTIERSLQSIRNQKIDQSGMEILIIDAGSTDRTIEIAKKYNVKILFNNRKLPEFAKHIGLMHAKGKYGVFIDSDEMFENMFSIKRRIEFLDMFPKVKNLVSTGMKCRINETGINRYANFIGDPFSNFIYRYNGFNRIEDMTKFHKYKEEKDAYIFDFSHSGYLPLFDALGNMFDINFAREIYEKGGKDKNFAANIFSNMVMKTKCAAMLENDYIYHEPNLNINAYLQKINWRVKNNIFQDEGVGFAARAKNENKLSKRKYLYIPYCLFVFPVFLDATRMVVKNKDIYFFLHIVFAEYTFLKIGYYMGMKILNIPVKQDKSYGKK